jgi:hypothetical protein
VGRARVVVQLHVHCVSSELRGCRFAGDGGHQVTAGEGDEFLGFVQTARGCVDVNVSEGEAGERRTVGRREGGDEELDDRCRG